MALLAFAACAAALRITLVLHWGTTSGRQIPVMLESAAAAVVAVCCHGPFGETERAAGGPLPWLRLGAALGLTAVAAGLLAAATIGTSVPGGPGSIVRDVAGTAGIGLICAALLGGLLGWTGPVGYLVVAEFAVMQSWTSPWAWPARPPGDRGAALCAAAILAAGLFIVATRGPRERLNE